MSLAALVVSLFALLIAASARGKAVTTERRSKRLAEDFLAAVAASKAPTPLPKLERAARAHAAIQAAAGAEMALAEHADHAVACMMLASARRDAAFARAELEVLGVQP